MSTFIQIWDDHETQTVGMHVVVDGKSVADLKYPPDQARKIAHDLLRWAEMPSQHNLEEEDCQLCRSRQ